MSTKWTEAQQNAISYHDCNLLVSAAAGSGKTAVLIQRIIEQITRPENPVDVDRLLVMTFTNAAASEMRERLAKALLEKLEEAPENTALQKQYMLLGKASIMTMHSFCLNLIKENYHFLSLDPAFSVGDTDEMKLLLNDAFEEAFHEMVVARDQNFIEILKAFGGKSGKGILELGKKVFATIQSNPWPEVWLDESVAKLEEASQGPMAQTFYGSKLIENAREKIGYYIERITTNLSFIREAQELVGYVDTLSTDLVILQSMLGALDKDWDAMITEFDKFEFDRMSAAKKGADEGLKELTKKLRDEYKSEIKAMQTLDFALDEVECRSDFEVLHRQFSALCAYIKLAKKKFAESKTAAKVLDFTDFEHFALELLIDSESKEPTDLAKALREKFIEVLIDEYQDTNDIQETILQAVSRAGEDSNLFMVGDVKQSIYRFRHAKPELFMKKSKKFKNDATAMERKVILGKNFRSRGELLEKINFIFASIMTEKLGDVEYSADEFLNPGATYPMLETNDAPLEINLIDMAELDDGEIEVETKDEDKDLDVKKNAVAEARFVISRIQELMSADSNFQIIDKETKDYRKPRFSDFTLLMRAANAWAPDFEEQFNLAGIPVFSDVSTSLFETIEVMSVMSLLKALNNPLEDISLISLLRSNFFGFTNNELADIRIASRTSRFFDAVQASTAPHTCAFMETFTDWRMRAGVIPISELVWGILSDTGYFTFVGGLPDGRKRQNNLKLLFEYIRNFERAGMVGLFNLIDYLENVFGNSGDMGEARLIGEEDNVVRIMSIHKSKGLEFPIVFLAGLGKSFNKMDVSTSVLVHQNEGFGPDLIRYDRNLKYHSVAKRALKVITERDNISEEMRILYVGLTRAKEKLILVASLKNAEDAIEKIKTEATFAGAEKLHPVYLMKSPSFIKWVVSALAKHEGPVINFWHHSVFAVDVPQATLEQGQEPAVKAMVKIDKWLETKDEQLFDTISKDLSWVPAASEELRIPAKITVTELKKMEESGRFDENAQPLLKQVNTNFNQPAFTKSASDLSGADIGTAYHKVFFILDFSQRLTIEEVESQLESMRAKLLISEAEFAHMDASKILAFANSEMGDRIRSSGGYFKERSFLFRLDEANDTIVQGVIDLFFVTENDEIVLIDYKSDRAADLGELTSRYLAQIEYYARALSQITGKKVSERYLYLVNVGDFIKI